ncbi:NAD(P)/FAD-dependent oxidoreductase [Brevundimonas intermedia]|uniref:NAD(P)/FAD-dependent oxidoreductase n=1 Tax=Brevundimonas intermedia TaxID=74315 RepID=UPI0022F25787|nr:FAD-binding oxidoreductase [Brevundimonas intermedia]
MSSPTIVIVGAGVLGLSTAFELKRRGHRVTVVDPGGPNASRVAAGMVAPAMEAAIDDVSPDRAALFRAGRDLWPAFAAASGVALTRRPAEWRGGDVDAIAARLTALCFSARREGDRVVTDEDCQIEPDQAMAALSGAVGEAPDGAIIEGRVTGLRQVGDEWQVDLDRRTLAASAVVLATGTAAAVTGTPDATRILVDGVQPIRGQIGVAARELTPHAVRGPGAYVAPMTGGAVIGATMEPGRRDTTPDAAVGERLTEAAWRVLGRAPEPLNIEWRAGVRGASADGLPIAGPAPDGEGLFLALAPRRNGWLLGPLVASVVADAIEGRTPSPEARALDPRRF